MDDLAVFIRARLAEIEQAAAAASEGPWVPWRGNPGLGLRGLEYAVTLPGQGEGSPAAIAAASWLDAEHIALHDPAHELRVTMTMRAILVLDEPMATRLLGAIWIGHPDYRDEWKP
jgi:hypothetical protein